MRVANGPPQLGSIGGFFGTEQSRQNIATAQEASFREDFVDGVYAFMPVKGFVIWDNHAFNLTSKSTELEQWLNLKFARPDDRQFLREQIFDVDDIFGMGEVAPFTSREICGSYEIPQHARLLTLSSHTHRYGKEFRVWYPPNKFCKVGDAECTPPTDEPDYISRTYR